MPGRKFRPLKFSELLAAIGVIVLFAVCGVVYYCTEILSPGGWVDNVERCYDNVYINGQPVEGMSEPEIRAKFMDTETSPATKDIIVTIDESKWTIPVKEIDARYDIENAGRQASHLGHSGPVMERLATVFSLRLNARNFTFNLLYDEQALQAQVDRIVGSINSSAQEARLEFTPKSAEKFVITNEVYGKTVDKAALLAALYQRLKEGSFEPIALSSQKQNPSITSEMLASQSQLIASYTTELTGDVQRNQNIVLAAEAVNGIVLKPGEMFSFNKATGERTSQGGYVEAPTIANNQLVDAPGGGVCQVSTTIYNAAILAGVDIIERHHHSWPVFYAPAGQDSTVDYGRKDLRFQNSLEKTIYLIVSVDLAKKTIVVDIYSKPAEGSVQIDVQYLESIKPDRAVEIKNIKKLIGYRELITKARDGCRVKVYRVFLKDGVESRRELISEDYYTPMQAVVEVGSKIPPGGDPNGNK